MDKDTNIIRQIYGIAAGWKQMEIEKQKYTDEQMRLVTEVAIARISKIIEDNGKL